MILIDLQKAFDSIGHEIFLKKLNCLDFSETTIAWSRSYLENRYFVVNIDNPFFEKACLDCGVPKSSISGLLLFLIYANDMPQVVCDLYLSIRKLLLSCLHWKRHRNNLRKSKQFQFLMQLFRRK